MRFDKLEFVGGMLNAKFRNCVAITKYSQYGYVCRGRCLIVPFQSVQLTKIRADVGIRPYICGLY